MAKGDGNKIIDRMSKYLEDLCQTTEAYGKQALEQCGKKCPSNRGVYVFYKGVKPLYVGRSDRIKTRLQQHGNGKVSAKYSPAAFAVIVAKERLLRKRHPEYIETPMRDIWNLKEFKAMKYGKVKDCKDFRRFFCQAQKQICAMRVGIVQIDDPNEQSIFEVYAHLELDTPYNSFRNH